MLRIIWCKLELNVEIFMPEVLIVEKAKEQETLSLKHAG